LASAQSTYTYTSTLKGTFYLDTTCATSNNYNVNIVYNSATGGYGCDSSSNSGSTGWLFTGECTPTTIGGVSYPSYWAFYAYQGATGCPASGSSSPAGSYSVELYETGTTYGSANNLNVVPASSSTVGCFKPSGCTSGASTLIVPSFLLVALAFAASKLQF
jgi:hypothetical protein